jgi:glycosyltransferase involved in cell wall biosynthesis
VTRVATAVPARGVITLSQSGANAQAAIPPARRQRIVYPGVELDRFDVNRLATPGALRARLRLPAEGPLVGIVTRLQRWKGVHVLIEAVARLVPIHHGLHCVIVGGTHDLEREYRGELMRQVSALALQSHVTFAGLQPNVQDWMQAMDVVVHASDHEPFGIVVIEAMALGKPVIAGSAGGPSEIINPGVNGLLAPFGDAVALASALRRYIEDPQFARNIGDAARRRAGEFSAREYAANVISAVRDLSA